MSVLVRFHFLAVLVVLVMPTPAAIAAEWASVTQNAAGDRFLIDASSIQRKADAVVYWEYREFPQPNNAFLEEVVNKPVHGVVLNWAANCTSKTQRLRQVTAYDKERQVIKRFTYSEGNPSQPKVGSSAIAVLNYACEQR